MTEGARRRCRLALTRKNTDTHDELQLALFSSNDWSEESRQVIPKGGSGGDELAYGGLLAGWSNQWSEEPSLVTCAAISVAWRSL